MDGLTFNEMNQWREEAALKLKVLSETSGYKCTVINPCDFYNPVEDVRYQTDHILKECPFLGENHWQSKILMEF